MFYVTQNETGTANETNATLSWTWAPLAWEWWEVLQLLLALAGIVGNFLVMVVLFRVRRSRCSTDTLIAGLALADFLTSVFIIPHRQVETLPDTTSAQLYCRIIHSSFFMWVTISASIFTLTTISIERLVAVVRPFQFKRIFSPERTLVIVAGIWLVSFLLNFVIIFVVYFEDGSCVFGYTSVWHGKLTGIIVFLFEFLFPVVTMLVAHVFTVRALRRSSHTNASSETNNFILQARRKITRMLLEVIIVFIISWTPDQVFYFAINVGLVEASNLYSPFYRSFVVLAFVNSCVNPVIYAARNPNFRKALMELCGSVRSLRPIFAGMETRDSQMRMLDGETASGSNADISPNRN
ncbi:mu-type opioid receptor [Strongylocentrotus purpuratus]|uniref:G-protein coupled receptors family 1 profile domain-containing protein n=1 Tax=Strongylocentrotus purpuratus TaxID=7668 RepID=A0A7M7HLD2_STRPU|nr:mu-type opioid receptor [Strongylocentrotus purpuratus]|eukprot:XP_011664179.1 PREDICTED: mu-type opioid receptor-like [Strongylocentrotus purpuratus]